MLLGISAVWEGRPLFGPTGDGEVEEDRCIPVDLIWGIFGALEGWIPAAAICEGVSDDWPRHSSQQARPARLTLAKEGLLELMPGSTDEAMVSSMVEV